MGMIKSRDEYSKKLNILSNSGLWHVDAIKYEDKILEISGWAKSPFGDTTNVAFTVNEKEFAIINYPLHRKDVGDVFWYDPYAKNCGFECRTELNSNEYDSDDGITLKFVDKKTKKSFSEISPKDIYFSKKKIFNILPIPDEGNRVRVHGDNKEFTFLFNGFQVYNNCKNVLETIFNSSIDSCDNILDWGCGCGRLSRYFFHLKKAKLTGIDIDNDNINWCKKNLKFGSFFTTPLLPPTKLGTAEYDLIIGISVFTHLDEQTQYRWLEELNRISSDDAVILMSIHGDTTLCFSPPDLNNYNTLQDKGFLDIGHDSSLDDVIDNKKYYRSVFHTNDYIQKNWSKYFEIVKILPCYINNHQDLVVMQKK